jgi:predicted ATP-grasp superfamily ATP-dependent carboligase
MLAAFGGWNDAGEAATGAISHLTSMWATTIIARVDPEDFYDFQVNRPVVFVDEAKTRQLVWPGTDIYGVETPHLPFDFILVKGVEPSMRWKSFTNDLLDLADDLDVAKVITLGALLADSPHSRPIPVSKNAAHPEIAERLSIGVSDYQGPTGIIGTLQDAAFRRGVDAISLWSAIPHYASLSPSPKATLALVHALEDFLNISLPLGNLPELSRDWESSIDGLASEDSEIGDYVRQLEAAKDATELPEATGESIAREFERYLRRRNTEN